MCKVYVMAAFGKRGKREYLLFATSFSSGENTFSQNTFKESQEMSKEQTFTL